MRSRNMLKSVLVILLAVMVNYGFAANWYVRPPKTGTYGAENGQDHADAWNGFSHIVWGASGVKAGDTLYVCGTHSGHYNYLTVGASGSDGAPIIISGDCPPSLDCPQGDPGIIDGSTDIKSGPWLNVGGTQWMYNNAAYGYSNYVLINDQFCKRVDNLIDMNTQGLWYFDYSTYYIYIDSDSDPANNTDYSTIRVGWYGNENGIIVDAHDYITIKSLTFQRIESRLATYDDSPTDPATGYTNAAILIKNSKYCNVNNNHITQCARGIMVAGTSDYCTVDSNRIDKSFLYYSDKYWYAYPIFSVANWVTISNNTIDGQITFYDGTDNGTTLCAGSGIELETQNYQPNDQNGNSQGYYCYHARVYGNEVKHDSWWGIRCQQYFTISGIQNIDVAVHDNYIHDSDSYSIGAFGTGEEDGIGFGCMAGNQQNHFTGISAYSNVIENFVNSGIIVCNYWDGIDIYDNLIVGCGYSGAGGIYLSADPLSECTVYNNTIYNSYGDGIACEGGSGIIIENNIIDKATPDPNNQGGHGKAIFISVNGVGVTENHNCLWVTDSKPISPPKTPDSSDKILDPGFFSIADGNYHLGNGSPCIGTGANIGPTCDLDGCLFGSPSMGCYAKNNLGWWKFDESSGNAMDSSGNTQTATLYGNPSRYPDNLGNALSLVRNSSQYASISYNASNDPFNYTNGATAAAWIKVNSLPTNQNEVDGIWADIDSVAHNGICVNINKDGKILFYVGGAGGYTCLTSSTAVPTGSWHHVACTYDNTTMKIYINGTLDNSVACNLTITGNTRTKLIGKASWGTYCLDGYIDDVRVFGRPLNSSDVMALTTPTP